MVESVCRPFASGWGIRTCKQRCAMQSRQLRLLIVKYERGVIERHNEHRTVSLSCTHKRRKEQPALPAFDQKVVSAYREIILSTNHVSGLYWPRIRTRCTLSAH